MQHLGEHSTSVNVILSFWGDFHLECALWYSGSSFPLRFSFASSNISGSDHTWQLYITCPKKYFGDLLILNQFSWQEERPGTNEFGQEPRSSNQAAVDSRGPTFMLCCGSTLWMVFLFDLVDGFGILGVIAPLAQAGTETLSDA